MGRNHLNPGTTWLHPCGTFFWTGRAEKAGFVSLKPLKKRARAGLGTLRHSPPILGLPRLGGTGTPGPARTPLSIA